MFLFCLALSTDPWHTGALLCPRVSAAEALSERLGFGNLYGALVGGHVLHVPFGGV